MQNETMKSLEDLQLDVNQYLSQQFEVEHEIIKTETITNALQLDSLDLLDLIVSIEEKYGLKISSEEIKQIQTMNDLYLFIYNNQS